MCPVVPDRRFQRQHYDDIVRSRRPTRWGLSCGYHDRYDPALLDRRPALRRAWERLLDRLLPEPTGTLLDVGCGTAYYWPLLATRCERLVGLDLSPVMAAEGRRHRQMSADGDPGHPLCADGASIPLSEGAFDAVLAVDVLHHASHLGGLLAEISRVLAPGGRLAAVEPNVVNPVVFVAHLVPPEERGALWPNHPGAIRRALEERFVDLETAAVTYVSGIDCEPALRLVEAADPLLCRPPLSHLALRRTYVARRP